jgi:hypothetical protein
MDTTRAGVEMTGPARRELSGMIIEFFWSIGMVVIVLIAYFLHDWRHLQLTVSLPGLVFAVYYW